MTLYYQGYVRAFQVSKFSWVLLLSISLVLGTWGGGLAKERYGPSVLSSSTQHSPLLEVFSSHYRALEERAENGEVSPQIGDKAYQLWTSLQHYLIDSHALIRQLRGDIKQSQGLDQEQAIDKLLEAGAERERTLMTYILRLEELLEDSERKYFLLEPPADSQSRSIRLFDAVAEEEAKEFKIEIEVGAEDLTQTEME